MCKRPSCDGFNRPVNASFNLQQTNKMEGIDHWRIKVTKLVRCLQNDDFDIWTIFCCLVLNSLNYTINQVAASKNKVYYYYYYYYYCCFVIKTSDEKRGRRFDRSTVIFKFTFMDKKFRIHTNFWDNGMKSEKLSINIRTTKITECENEV